MGRWAFRPGSVHSVFPAGNVARHYVESFTTEALRASAVVSWPRSVVRSRANSNRPAPWAWSLARATSL
ncbi:MAG: hypothetical protein A2Z04_03805 [Chloroflexi bacterium RBG_16_57_9]|nr:MAG: hypothetical protein A2Z04_03805 [Chloroflexi bacterium RBG_16_57_9]